MMLFSSTSLKTPMRTKRPTCVRRAFASSSSLSTGAISSSHNCVRACTSSRSNTKLTEGLKVVFARCPGGSCEGPRTAAAARGDGGFSKREVCVEDAVLNPCGAPAAGLVRARSALVSAVEVVDGTAVAAVSVATGADGTCVGSGPHAALLGSPAG
jgi:hypothetical protein